MDDVDGDDTPPGTDAEQLLDDLRRLAESNRRIVTAIQDKIESQIEAGQFPDVKLLGQLERLSEAASKQSSRYFKLADLKAPDDADRKSKVKRDSRVKDGMYRQRERPERVKA